MKNKTNKLFASENLFLALLILQIILQFFLFKDMSGDPYLDVVLVMIGALSVPLIIGLVISTITFYIKKKKELFLNVFLRITSFVLFFWLFFSLFGYLA